MDSLFGLVPPHQHGIANIQLANVPIEGNTVSKSENKSFVECGLNDESTFVQVAMLMMMPNIVNLC